MGGQSLPQSAESEAAAVSVGQAARLYPRRLMVAVVAFGIAVALAVVVALGVTLLSGRQQALEAGRQATASLARAATDSTARVVQSVDVVLASIGEALRDRPNLGPVEMAEMLRQRLLLTPQLRQLLVVDRNGKVLADSAGSEPGTPVPELEDLFARHAGSVRPLVIGQPVFRRLLAGAAGGGQYLIPMSRPFIDGREEATGYLVAGVNPQHFLTIFDALDIGPDGLVSLHRFDGMLLVGREAVTGKPGQVCGNLPLFASELKTGEFGTFLAEDPDGRKRITSYRMTLVWPLVVSVGMTEATVLTAWERQAKGLAIPVGVVAATVLGLTAVLARLLIRRARDEEALLLSDMALVNVTDGVTITDALAPDNPLVYVNPAFSRITGYDLETALGRNPRFLHGTEADQEGLEAIRRSLAVGMAATTVLRNFRRDGSLFWNELTVNPVHDHAGRIVHYVGVQRDITHRVETEAKLRRSLDEAARANAELARFSEILAHHLQEPVRAVVNFAQALERRLGAKLEAGDKDYLDFAVTAGLRLKALLRDVELYLSVERRPLADRPLPADTALDEALRRLNVLMLRSGGEVERSPLPEVWVDQWRLTEVFFRLIENSLRYSDPDRLPVIRVSAEVEGAAVRFHLADNGVGIAPEYRERAFRVFERLHTVEHPDGTGIGLALVHKIVTGLGGTVELDANPDGGTMVTFTVPKPSR